MASITRNPWKTAPEAAQIEIDRAKAVAQARNYLSRIM